MKPAISVQWGKELGHVTAQVTIPGATPETKSFGVVPPLITSARQTARPFFQGWMPDASREDLDRWTQEFVDACCSRRLT